MSQNTIHAFSDVIYQENCSLVPADFEQAQLMYKGSHTKNNDLSKDSNSSYVYVCK